MNNRDENVLPGEVTSMQWVGLVHVPWNSTPPSLDGIRYAWSLMVGE